MTTTIGYNKHLDSHPFLKILGMLRRGGSIKKIRLAKPRELSASGILREVRSYDFTSYSDFGLREALINAGHPSAGTSSHAALPEVFAIVNEAISRRLGTWRLFNPDFDKVSLKKYEELACQVIARGPYREKMGFYADPDFLESEAFDDSVAPLLVDMGLKSAEQTIVKSMVYVSEKSRTDYDPNILLPADFYGAISERDTGGVVRFNATDEQIVAGVHLYRGDIVEMNAGEGKTIAAAFPAVLHGLSGRRVHIITANDYLASRDADLVAPVCESLGLTVGAVLGYMGDDERRHAYRQQIVYGTLRDFGFDYLRGNLKTPSDGPVQEGLDVVIIDEADHVLIDQARTPLIISGDPVGNKRAFKRTQRAIESMVALQADIAQELEGQLRETREDSGEPSRLLSKLLLAKPDSEELAESLAQEGRLYSRILAMADDDSVNEPDEKLSKDLYYAVDTRLNSVLLTELGQDFLETQLGPIFDNTALEWELASLDSSEDLSLEIRRDQEARLSRQVFRHDNQMSHVYQTLRAYVLMKKNVDYVVSDGLVILIDEQTGRTLPDNRYQQGLHAAIEAKEGVPVQPEYEILAQISVQGLINLYPSVAGMTGTAHDAEDELEGQYGLNVLQVPPTQPSLRTDFGSRLYPTHADKLAAIVDEVKFWRRVGRPVLVGTLTIEQSEEVSRSLHENGVQHNLLNAVTDHSEAEIIRNAGDFGAVTIATNMAGRGTDIILEPGLDERILQRYVRFVEQLAIKERTRVEITCSTREEAQALGAALSRRSSLAVTFTEGSRRTFPNIVAVSSELTQDGDNIRRLEFGLGLYVIGTEMNQSVRIDRQLRGRSGRQGAFGATRFILSREDQTLSFQSRNVGFHARDYQVDWSGRVFVEGPRLERYLNSIQGDEENENEVRRGLIRDYTRVLEAQTLAYYRSRQDIVQSNPFHDVCKSFVKECSARVVEKHFPELSFSNYNRQFDSLAEELWLDFGIDSYSLEGTSLTTLVEKVADLHAERLWQLKTRLSDAEVENLAKHVFLQTSDELWKVHLSETQELMLNIPLGAQGHKAAVADYAIQCFKMYEEFQESVIDSFLAKLLTFETETEAAVPETTVILTQDVSKILV